jgi:hypothetical protein
MFPWVYGFTWTFGSIIFLGTFFAVLIVVVTTITKAVKRAILDLRTTSPDKLLWDSEFAELPSAAKHCRHELTGEVRHRLCDNGFDCRSCTMHPIFKSQRAATATVPMNNVIGFDMPPGRYYHRGHTWVKPELDGTVTVGLDEFGKRILGKHGTVKLPRVGDRVSVNGTGWRVEQDQSDVRILSPVDGEVVATADAQSEWQLRVKPDVPVEQMVHLLHESEVLAWMNREFERLQTLLAKNGVGVALADGGVLVEDLTSSDPTVDWDYVRGEMLLDV